LCLSLLLKRREKGMFRKVSVVTLALIALMSLMLPRNVAYAQFFKNPHEIVVDTIVGGSPVTLDPANCYDAASIELLSNIYETLIFFDGERCDYFIPQLAEQVWVAPPDPAAPDYTNFTVYFKVRVGMPFHTWSRSDLSPVPVWDQYYLTTEDVEHSFERLMVYDLLGGILLIPLLDCYGADPTWPSDETNPINLAVQRNATHVWLNIANKDRTPRTSTPSWTPVPLFEEDPASPWYGRQRPWFWSDVAVLPLSYPLRVFLQAISQPWAGIMSKQWLADFVDPLAEDAGHPTGEWLGTWENWTLYWTLYCYLGPCVDIIPGGVTYPGVTCGTGPYILDWLQWSYGWSLVKFDSYWRGWHADWPSPPYPSEVSSGIRPAGWVERLTVRQLPTSIGIYELLSGDADFAYVPSARAGELHVGGDINGPTRPGIRMIDRLFPHYERDWVQGWYLTPLACAGIKKLALVVGISDYQYVNDLEYSHWDAIEIADYLSDRGWDVTLLLNSEATKNVIEENLRFLATVANEWDYVLFYFSGHGVQLPDQKPIDETTDKYDEYICAYDAEPSNINGKISDDYLTEWVRPERIPDGVLDYPGTRSKRLAIILDCCHSGGFIRIINEHVYGGVFLDTRNGALIITSAGGINGDSDLSYEYTPHAHSKFTYHFIQSLSQTPSLEKAFWSAKDSMEYCNCTKPPNHDQEPLINDKYPYDWGVITYNLNDYSIGVYAYNLWKWPMTETVGAEGYFVGDVNFDGKVSMDDVIAIINSFGSYAGKAGMPVFHPKWNFYCDVDDSPRYRVRNRKIDMGDIVNCLNNFGKRSIPWHP
jgi:ABC-type transport system substrate-binding protein